MNINNLESPQPFYKKVYDWLDFNDEEIEEDEENEIPPLKPNAPKEIQEAYKKLIELQKECDKLGICID